MSKSVLATLFALSLAACGGDSTSSAHGTLALRLTDAPFLVDSVRSVDVFVVRVDGKLSDADSSESAKGAPDDSAEVGGWTTLATPNASVNLLAYQGGVSLSLGSESVPAGTYHGFRLIIDPTRSSITLKNGLMLSGVTVPNVSFPSASRSGIKITLSQGIVVTADETTTLLVDFDVANSFVLRGNTIQQNGLLFKPVIRAAITQ